MRSKNLCRSSLIFLLLFVSWFTPRANAQQATLGSVDFPTSAKSPEVQKHFVRGVAALHSFWFEEALEEFRQATKIEPDFMMGYWGEAMAHNHPLWSEQDTESGRKVITRLAAAKNLSPKEQAFIGAVRALYGDGDKLARDKAYALAMEKIYNDYPNDYEAAIFYSLSLLGTVRSGDKGFVRQMRAAAIALDVYQKNPNHPGAAHFIIHAFDDPEHAILALPAAYRYAQIAPESAHARHMPSHIFVQLGMWDNVATSNESAWEASDTWVKRKNLPLYLRDYHSLHWLNYAYIEQGRYKKAEQIIEVMRDSMRKGSYENEMRPNYYENNYVNMIADFIVGTERWSDARQLFEAMPKTVAKAQPTTPQGGEHAGHNMSSGDAKTVRPTAQRFRYASVFINGLAAAATGNTAEAEKSAAELGEVKKQFTGPQAKAIEIMQLEVSASAASMKGKHDEAIEMMKRATALEEDMSPPSGPPTLIKPSHELLGEILLRANRPKDAAQAFAVSLARQPNRVRSLVGAARAADKNGDTKTATESYSRLLKIWSKADTRTKDLIEAQDYLKQAQGR
jgi:tetratricopeptide (TPR) repeat protein